jgi:peptide/nickel transport system permease protein
MSAATRAVRRRPLFVAAIAILALLVAVAALAPWIARDGPFDAHFADALRGPGADYWLGTDFNGRDIFSRLVYGAQVTVLAGFGAVLLMTVLALAVGLTSGYAGGWADLLLQRVVDAWQALPPIFLILTLVAVLNPGGGTSGFLGLGRGPDFGPNPAAGEWLWHVLPRTAIVTVALGLVLAGGASRVVRAAVIETRARPYVAAAAALGASPGWVVRRHVLPAIAPVLAVYASAQLGVAVVAEATVTFLGQGVAGYPTWGDMLSGQARALAPRHPHLIIFPALALVLTVFAANALGDGLRDLLDPRLRARR